MPSLNQVLLIGNVGRKPTVKQTQTGTPIAMFSVATDEEWTDKDGTRKERTEWHRVVAWGRLAEVVGEQLDGGRQVHVQGALRTREFTDAAGARKSVTEVHATRLLFLGSRPQATEASNAPTNCTDDEILF